MLSETNAHLLDDWQGIHGKTGHKIYIRDPLSIMFFLAGEKVGVF